jgi:hypothetical protein
MSFHRRFCPKTPVNRRLSHLGSSKNRGERAKFAPRSGPFTFTPCKALIYTNTPQARNLTAQQVLRSSHLPKARHERRRHRNLFTRAAQAHTHVARVRLHHTLDGGYAYHACAMHLPELIGVQLREQFTQRGNLQTPYSTGISRRNSAVRSADRAVSISQALCTTMLRILQFIICGYGNPPRPRNMQIMTTANTGFHTVSNPHSKEQS